MKVVLLSRLLLILWLGLCNVDCTDDYLCPDAVPGWQERELSVDEMRAVMKPYTRERALRIESHGSYCEPVPVGVDARNGRPLYIRLLCDDVCPDYSQFLMTYAWDIPAGEPCEDDGLCSLLNGASISPIYCMPYAQGYCRCGSESFCNWNGVCEPENRETPMTCPIECPCGSVGSGPSTDWLAAGFELPRHPADASELSNFATGGLTNTVSRYLSAWQEVVGDASQFEQELVETSHSGGFLWLLRWEAEPYLTDDYIALRLRLGPPQIQPLSLDGTDELVVAHPFEGVAVVCGHGWNQYHGETGAVGRAAQALLSLPLPGLWRALAPLVDVRVWVLLDASNRLETRVTGILPLSALESHLLPTLASDLNTRVATGGAEAARIAAALDGTCDPTLCPEVTPGQGPCSVTSPPDISTTEIRCNPAFFEALAPDYDIDGDGEPDGLWFGFRVAPMVSIRLVEP